MGQRQTSVARATDQQYGPAADRDSATNERRLRALVTASSDGVYRMSADWGVMHQMKRHMEDQGFLGESEEANPNWLNDYVLKEDHQEVLSQIRDAIASRSIFEFEHRVRRADGTVGWIHSRAVPILDDGGEIAEWLGTASDITPRKQSMDALIQNEKLSAMGRLAASIAHEINNPLESVMNLIYLASTSDDIGHIRGFLTTADQELARAVAIANQTLRFHKQSTAPTEIFGADLLDSVLLVHRGRITNARVQVEVRMRAQRPVFCFEGEIRQVINNLVGNATDAMHRTGGRLLIRCRDGRNWATGEAGLVLTVADTGPGMSPETRKKAFEAFYTTKGLEGTGLGLWVSAEIVQRHRGRLSLRTRTKPASGTVFSLFLPYAAARRSDSTPAEVQQH